MLRIQQQRSAQGMSRPGQNGLGKQINRRTTRLPKGLLDELLERGDIKQKQTRKRPAKTDKPSKAASKADVKSGEPPKKKQKTALEKLANKTAPPRSKLFKDPVEAQEAREIAWLEAQLGIGSSKKAASKAELAEDGLDDLFGDLDRVESKLGLQNDSNDYDKVEESESDEEDELDVSSRLHAAVRLILCTA